MAQKVYAIADFQQGSTWTIDDNMNVTAGPSTDIDTKSVTFSDIPAGSVINGATLTADIGATNYLLRTLDGVFFNGTRNVKAKVAAGDTASFEFRFKGSGNPYLGAGTHTSYLHYTNVNVTVDYTPPSSGLSLNKATCKASDAIRATITPSIAGTTHKLKYAMTGITTVTSVMIPAGTNIYDYTPPLTWQNVMPNDLTRTVTVTLETYSGGVKVAETSKTFTLLVSDDAYPAITGFTATRIAGFTDASITGYVQGFSQAGFQSAASGAYGASITQYKVTMGTWSAIGADVTCPVLEAAGTNTATLEVTDSRGRKTTTTVNIEVVAYAHPALNTPVRYRSDAVGVKAPLGTFIYVKTGVLVSSLGGANTYTLKVRIYQKGTTAPAWTEPEPAVLALTADQQRVPGGFSISYSYVVDIKITDKLGSYTYTAVVPSSSVAFSLKAGGLGAAFGKFAELDDALEIAWTKALLGGNPVAAYRVGNIFFTFEEESPATLFPGTTWEKLGAGQFLVSAGTGYAALASGGEAAHTLALTEIPSHKHTYGGLLGSAAAFGTQSSIYLQRAVGPGTTAASDSYHAVGGGNAHNNMPPWIAVNMWRRTS